MLLIIKRRGSLNWIKLYLKEENIPFYSISYLLFIKKNDLKKVLMDLSINDLIQDTRFVDESIPTKQIFLEISNRVKSTNIELFKIIYELECKGYRLKIDKVYDIDFNSILIDVYKGKDLILSFKDIEFEINLSPFYRILNGEIIMSQNKEAYLISEVTKECDLYDLNLKNYEYYIEDQGNNIYNVNLENIISGKKIIVRNIVLNEDDKVISIGSFSGFVL